MMQEMENVYEIDPQTEQGSVKDDKENGNDKQVVGSADLGKFKDVSALMQAYQSLQAEFTRRSQRLKRYERELDNQAQEDTARVSECSGQASADVSEQTPVRPDSTKEESVLAVEMKELHDSTCKDSDGENKTVTHGDGLQLLGQAGNSAPSLYEQVMASEEVRLKIVGDYLSSLGKNGAPLMKGGGGVLTAPAKKPVCIADAGKMALAYLQGQKTQG